MKQRRGIAFLFVLTLGLLLGEACPAAADPPREPPPPALALDASATAAGGIQLEAVGYFGGEAHAVAVRGNYAYLGVGPGLAILDISKPAHPLAVGLTRILPEVVEDVAVAGDYAYVADGYGGLRIIHIANPAAPTEVGSYTRWSAAGVTLAGSYAYVASQYAGLRILSVANPAAPVEVGYLQLPQYAEKVAIALQRGHP